MRDITLDAKALALAIDAADKIASKTDADYAYKVMAIQVAILEGMKSADQVPVVDATEVLSWEASLDRSTNILRVKCGSMELPLSFRIPSEDMGHAHIFSNIVAGKYRNTWTFKKDSVEEGMVIRFYTSQGLVLSLRSITKVADESLLRAFLAWLRDYRGMTER